MARRLGNQDLVMNMQPSHEVRMQFLRPAQLEKAVEEQPIVYVPFGIIEWHGPHLPLGTDAINAEAVTTTAAARFGGVVYPAVYFHEAFDRDGPDGTTHLQAVLTKLFERLRRMGFRVIVGVSGHGIDSGKGHPQVTMIENALAPVLRGEHVPVHDRRLEGRLPDGGVAGIGVTETGLVYPHAEAGVDHAGYWETCDMLHLCPDSVDLGTLQHGREGIHSPDGDPAEATAEVGATKLDICADAVGRRALQLLESLPADKQRFGNSIDGIHWWMV